MYVFIARIYFNQKIKKNVYVYYKAMIAHSSGASEQFSAY